MHYDAFQTTVNDHLLLQHDKIILAKHLYLHHLLTDRKHCMCLEKWMLFDEILHRWSLEKRLRCLCNLSHLTACDWITRDVNTRCKQGHRDLWEAYVSCSLCCFPSECSVISRSMRACWLIIQSSLVFPLVHSAQKTKEARNQCYGRVWLRTQPPSHD